eukprot:jgi/Tetstr1/421183/TSEL_012225.t1
MRHLNSYCVHKRIKMETLMGLRHLTKKGYYMFSFGLKDGFYAARRRGGRPGLLHSGHPGDTLPPSGAAHGLVPQPVLLISPYYFATFTEVMVRHIRTQEPEPAPAPLPPPHPYSLAGARTGKERILPYHDDFLLFADTEAAALGVRARMQRVMDALGIERHAKKVFWEPAQFGPHLGINSDLAAGVFYARRPSC